jgi:hypothetical protein
VKSGARYAVLSWGAAALVTVVLLAGWVTLYLHHAASIAPGMVTQIDRTTIVSKGVIEVYGFTAMGIGLLGIALRTWRRSAPILLQEIVALLRAHPGVRRGPENGVARRRLTQQLLRAARQVAGGGMADCEDVQQWLGHVLTMWGFMGLFATTSLDALVNPAAQPLALLHPVRLLGNLTGMMFMAGLTLAIARRALLERARSATRLPDWTFLLSLWGTGASGFLVQWYADFADPRGTAWSYTLHLGFVGFILAAAPWTKFVHAAWRPSWVVYRQLRAEPGT